MIRALIVDDEFNDREALKDMLHLYCPQVEVCGMAASVKEGLEYIHEKEPDLIFLDIEMPGGSGFTLFEHMKEVNANIVFISSCDQHALKAIKHGALYYLLKPIDPKELQEICKRMETKKTWQNFINPAQRLGSPIQKNTQKISLPSSEGYIFVDISHIIACTAESNYASVRLTDNTKICVSKTLKHLENVLPKETFLRIHNSTLVNLNYAVRYIRGEGGFVVMNDNSTYEISRRKKSEFLGKLGSI